MSSASARQGCANASCAGDPRPARSALSRPSRPRRYRRRARRWRAVCARPLPGWPLPRHVPTWHEVGNALSQHGLSDTAILDGLSCALWLCWAVLMLALLTESLALMVRVRSVVFRLPGASKASPRSCSGPSCWRSPFLRPRGRQRGEPAARGDHDTGRPPVLIRSPFGDGTSEHDGRIDAELTAVITDDPTRSDVPMSTSTSRAASGPASCAARTRSGGSRSAELGDPLSWRAVPELN